MFLEMNYFDTNDLCMVWFSKTFRVSSNITLGILKSLICLHYNPLRIKNSVNNGCSTFRNSH
jgi:hypothetical protein